MFKCVGALRRSGPKGASHPGMFLAALPDMTPASSPSVSTPAQRLPHRIPQRRNVGDGERRASAVLGAALVAAGLARRGRLGFATGLAGAGLLARGITGPCPVYGALERGRSRESGLLVSRSITLAAEPDRIRDALLKPSDWLEGGRMLSLEPTQSGFALTAHIPWLGDRRIELEAQRSDDGIAWRAKQGSWLRCQANAELHPAPGDRGTELRVRIETEPRGGFGAGRIRPFLSAVAERALGVALGRLKQSLETGETPSAGPQPYRAAREQARSERS